MTASPAPVRIVFDIVTGKRLTTLNPHMVMRVSPEYDGLEVLYSNPAHTDKLFSTRILCWGLKRDGEIVAMIPWVNRVIPCTHLKDPGKAMFEGYYNPATDTIFNEPPQHKTLELKAAAEYFRSTSEDPKVCIQEIPDTTGTHAMLASADFSKLTLAEILSWRLLNDGTIHAMLVNERKVKTTPVLLGDACLYAADASKKFRYFFQHHIANQIKAEDPAALAAVAMLLEN